MSNQPKKWYRVARRLARDPSSAAKALRQWGLEPAKTQRKYRRMRFLVDFARARAEGGGPNAAWWRARAQAWAEEKRQLAKQMEDDLGDREILPRSAWDSTPGDAATKPLANRSEGVFFHHSVSGSPTTYEGEAAEMRNLYSIARSRDFIDISYSFIIFESGRVWTGRGFDIEQAATAGYNDVSHSICFAGNFDGHAPSEAALASAAWLKAKLGASRGRGHRDVYATGCPGAALYNVLKARNLID